MTQWSNLLSPWLYSAPTMMPVRSLSMVTCSLVVAVRCLQHCGDNFRPTAFSNHITFRFGSRRLFPRCTRMGTGLLRPLQSSVLLIMSPLRRPDSVAWDVPPACEASQSVKPQSN